MNEFYDLISVPEACARLKSHLPGQLPSEEVGLLEACGRVLAEDVRAQEDVPGFRRSTVDGFAVRARDTFGASESAPAMLEVVGTIPMGEEARDPLPPLSSFAISTGGMLPPGADAVVMLEYVEHVSEGVIEVYRPVAPGENVVEPGDDLRAGQVILPAGHRLRPQDLGLLSAAGYTRVRVRRRPVVGILATGDEVVAPEEKPAPGQVRDVNSYSLAGLVQEAGGLPRLGGIVPDDYQALYRRSAELLAQCDLLLLSGGSSVGRRDYTLQVIQELGAPGVLVHGLALQPGKPAIGGVARGKPIFGLPGHPVSAMVVFAQLVRPVLEHLLGRRPAELPPPTVPARLKRNLPSAPGREDFVRVRLLREGDEWWAEPVLGKSGLLTTMTKADGLVRIPSASEGLLQGTLVQVELF
ncbi:MAG: molybdopterin-binding protein [Bacillota bacterium]|nr:molybdopterin-binding protein [Bacillota bacterium]